MIKSRSVSVDSLLSQDYVPDPPAPVLPVKNKKSRRMEVTTSPPPQPSRRSMMKQKKVTYDDVSKIVARSDPSHTKDLYYAEVVNYYDDDIIDDAPIPRLPSVKDLAALFQPKISPEPKPRKSLLKVDNLIHIF